ncbi:hypothetical protein LUZ62_072423 [Rhynchospora pubera]|uniref:Uncharacterized protein n=1 Tax=Rhynchospora pubera TaxID=906938 RepID=A0AAV8D593_9POAL|nr:hypothetical protein LUZ62_072423 [Rhynchospora pubera]
MLFDSCLIVSLDRRETTEIRQLKILIINKGNRVRGEKGDSEHRLPIVAFSSYGTSSSGICSSDESLSLSFYNSVGCTTVRKFGVFRRPLSLASSFTQGSCNASHINAQQRKARFRAMSLSIRCEQSAKESEGAIVWVGRAAMVGFATAITIEISTGKGLLEVLSISFDSAQVQHDHCSIDLL